MARRVFATHIVAAMLLAVCNSQPTVVNRAGSSPKPVRESSILATLPPSSSTGGFDGSQAFEHVRHLVEVGPRLPGSDGIRQAQS